MFNKIGHDKAYKEVNRGQLSSTFISPQRKIDTMYIFSVILNTKTELYLFSRGSTDC